MNLSKALELVLNEAESSALGDEHTNRSKAVLESVEVMRDYLAELKSQDDFAERMMKLLKKRWEKVKEQCTTKN